MDGREMRPFEGVHLDQELRRYQENSQRGARHEALLHSVRYYFIAGNTHAKPPAFSRPLVMIERHRPAESVAFLACFTSAVNDYVILLKQGINRVGRNPIWADYGDFPKEERLVEGRQWLMVCRSTASLIADDHSTNGSVILSGNAPELLERLFHTQWFSLAKAAPSRVELDWEGNTVYELKEGDVLVTIHGAFVYGCVPGNVNVRPGTKQT